MLLRVKSSEFPNALSVHCERRKWKPVAKNPHTNVCLRRKVKDGVDVVFLDHIANKPAFKNVALFVLNMCQQKTQSGDR
jgi:hypothetical protein